MATATTIPASRLHGHDDRPSMVSVGTIIWLSSELMFFAALFAAYFTIRSVSPELWSQNTEKLNVAFASVNTTVLVLSSVTCQLGVFAAERGQVGRAGTILDPRNWGLREWFMLTYVMGAIFIATSVLGRPLAQNGSASWADATVAAQRSGTAAMTESNRL